MSRQGKNKIRTKGGSGQEPDRFALFAALALAVLLVLFAGIGSLIYDDYGVTFDEEAHADYGRQLADYFLSQGARTEASRNPYGRGDGGAATAAAFGPSFELPIELWAAGKSLSFQEHFLARHAYNLAWGFICLLAVAGLAWRLGGPWTAFFSVLLLILNPRFFGHCFNNIKDIPFAVGMSLAVWAALAAVDSLHGKGSFNWPLLGLAWASAFLVRITGMAGIALAGGGLGLYYAGHFLNRSLGPPEVERALEKNLFRFALALVLVFGLTLALWPFVQQHPLDFWTIMQKRTAEALTGHHAPPTIFWGHKVFGGQAHLLYLPTWFFIGQPLLFVAAAMLGLGLTLGRWGGALKRWAGAWKSGGRRGQADREVALIARNSIILAWLIGLPLYLVLTRFHFYDGLRHVLFLVVGQAVLGGLALCWIKDKARQWKLRTGVIVALILFLGLLEPAWAIVRLHPFQISYFNPVAGGLKGAEAAGLEPDYWGGSTSVAARWLTRRTQGLKGPFLVKTSSPFSGTRFGLGPKLIPVLSGRAEDRQGDFYIGLRRWGMENVFPEAPVIHQVRREGVVMAVVKQLREIKGLPWPPKSGRTP